MTFNEARDVMLGIFYGVWQPLGYPVVWTDLPAEVPTTQTIWARVTLQHVSGEQATLANANGQKRWRREGFLTIQLFAPIGDGLQAIYDIAQSLVNAFQAAGEEVWLRNPRMREVGISGNFSQINVLTDFTYDDVR